MPNAANSDARKRHAEAAEAFAAYDATHDTADAEAEAATRRALAESLNGSPYDWPAIPDTTALAVKLAEAEDTIARVLNPPWCSPTPPTAPTSGSPPGSSATPSTGAGREVLHARPADPPRRHPHTPPTPCGRRGPTSSTTAPPTSPTCSGSRSVGCEPPQAPRPVLLRRRRVDGLPPGRVRRRTGSTCSTTTPRPATRSPRSVATPSRRSRISRGSTSPGSSSATARR